MTAHYRFYKEKDNRWYVDMPDWEGSKEDLEMVSGADMMLEIIAQGDDDVYLSLSDEEIVFTPLVRKLDGVEIDMDKYAYPKSSKIIKIKDTPEIGGAEYTFTEWCGIEYNLKIWLCSVTEYVFGYLPDTIYVL